MQGAWGMSYIQSGSREDSQSPGHSRSWLMYAFYFREITITRYRAYLYSVLFLSGIISSLWTNGDASRTSKDHFPSSENTGLRVKYTAPL